MDRYKFGEFIYQKRKSLGLTQEELGRKVGVTNKAVSKWEVGETLPDVMMLEPLAQVLQVTVDELLTHTDKKEEEKKNIKINKVFLYIIIGLVILEIVTIILFTALNKPEDEPLFITSPIVGTFYSAAAPDVPAFVKVGDHVKNGQTVCILEAMKLMNEIQCEYDCEIEAVLVSNEQKVEYGQPLFRVKKL